MIATCIADTRFVLDQLQALAAGGQVRPLGGRHGVDRPLLLLGTDGFRDARYERSWIASQLHRRVAPGGPASTA
jgi:hypothetical protein